MELFTLYFFINKLIFILFLKFYDNNNNINCIKARKIKNIKRNDNNYQIYTDSLYDSSNSRDKEDFVNYTYLLNYTFLNKTNDKEYKNDSNFSYKFNNAIDNIISREQDENSIKLNKTKKN